MIAGWDVFGHNTLLSQQDVGTHSKPVAKSNWFFLAQVSSVFQLWKTES